MTESTKCHSHIFHSIIAQWKPSVAGHRRLVHCYLLRSVPMVRQDPAVQPQFKSKARSILGGLLS